MRSFSFIKMQGLGNDFAIFSPESDEDLLHIASCAKKIANRNFGIGCDQLVLVLPCTTKECDVYVYFYNNDGSAAKMCGNGIRCVAKFFMEKKSVNNCIIGVKFGNNVDAISIHNCSQNAAMVSVEMGSFVIEDKDNYFVRIGNNHQVLPAEKCLSNGIPLSPQTQNSGSYNINYYNIMDDKNVAITTCEIGAGVTLACGSGISATVGYLVAIGKLATSEVRVITSGSLILDCNIFVTVSDLSSDGGRVVLTSTCNFVFNGVIDL